MMDIPTELRRIADIELTGYSEEMMRRAADRIDELERVLRAILDASDSVTEAEVALWMIGEGYATDDADTLDDLLGKLVHQAHAGALIEALIEGHNRIEELEKALREMEKEVSRLRNENSELARAALGERK